MQEDWSRWRPRCFPENEPGLSNRVGLAVHFSKHFWKGLNTLIDLPDEDEQMIQIAKDQLV